MLADISYEAAIKIVLPRRKKNADYGATDRQIIAALITLGFKVRHSLKGKKTITKIKRNALIVLKEGDHDYHAVVWDAKNKAILDPSNDAPISMGTTLVETSDGEERVISARRYYGERFFAYIEVY